MFVYVVALLAPLLIAGQPKQDSASTRSPHGTLNIACQSCHTSMSWKPVRAVPDFNHNKTTYPLRGMHTSVGCTQCHTKLVFTNVGHKCAECHADIHRGQMGAKCETCHSVKGWQVSIKDIQQHQNRFPLIGAHAPLTCESCHKGAANGQFVGLSTACFSCHSAEYAATNNPSHAKIGYGTDCQQCHTMDSWLGAQFDHLKFTGFALTGAHAKLECSACHANNVFTGARSTCVSCHLQDFNGSKNPPHRAAGFSQECSSCHSTVTWVGAKFDHNTMTKFPLTGAHVSTQCSQCHASGVFVGLATQCVSCHLTTFQATTNPQHASNGIPQTCEQCHSTANWGNASFDHSKTPFPLTGAHVTVQCTQCHTQGGNYAAAPTQCVGCHLANFQKTTTPNHVAAGFPQTCEQCHTTATWLNASFDHSKTPFPLTGEHVTVQCTQCHAPGASYAAAPTQCVGCHLATFQQTTNPNHASSGFPQTCEQCHTTASWLTATFDHSKTVFPLTGAHIALQCTQCHAAGSNFAATPTQCSGCHLSTFQATTNPNHVTGGFAQTCEQCHTTASWLTSTFNHTTMTKFPLTGAHIGLTCAQCHKAGAFSATPTGCNGCHSATFQATTNPNHVAAGFPTDCSVCHSTATWLNATFDHSKTLFPLTGFHATLTCSNCHSSGVFVGLSTTCVSCHLARFQATTTPNHTTSGFPTDCQVCHNTAVWVPSIFDHSKTVFPLTGAHITVACANCHVGGKYAGTPTDCYSCHKTLFTTTTNPNHVAAGFPTTCTTCHNTTAWTGATFNHTWFPIYNGGSHAGKWTTCGDCHTNPADYSSFTCINCHTHTKTATDQHHSGVRNYVYAATACYSCHRS
jgi:hypothetical protein